MKNMGSCPIKQRPTDPFMTSVDSNTVPACNKSISADTNTVLTKIKLSTATIICNLDRMLLNNQNVLNNYKTIKVTAKSLQSMNFDQERQNLLSLAADRKPLNFQFWSPSFSLL